MRMKLDAILTTTLFVCALTTTGFVLRRELFVSSPTLSRPAAKTVFVENWRAYLSRGDRIGRDTAPVQLMEFADFECPFCATFHSELKDLWDRYPGQISMSFVHFPIPGHRFAEPAARVAECAAAQGRFEAMQDRLFEQQGEFGLKPWSDFATEAGIADFPAFQKCIKSEYPMPKIAEGRKLAAVLDVQATPTVIINGWKLTHPPTEAELDQMVQRILAGKLPVDGKS